MKKSTLRGPLKVDFCILNYTVFYLSKISDISQCVLRVPLCDSCRLDLEKQRHLPVRARCAFCESYLLDLEKQRHLSVCYVRLLRELSFTGQVRPVLRKLFFRSLETATSHSRARCAFYESCRSRARCAFLYTHLLQ